MPRERICVRPPLSLSAAVWVVWFNRFTFCLTVSPHPLCAAKPCCPLPPDYRPLVAERLFTPRRASADARLTPRRHPPLYGSEQVDERLRTPVPARLALRRIAAGVSGEEKRGRKETGTN